MISFRDRLWFAIIGLSIAVVAITAARAPHVEAIATKDDIMWREVERRCPPPRPSESRVYSDDFHWNYEPLEMQARFDAIYESGKRLPDRAYFDSAKEDFVLPMSSMQGGLARLPRRLIESVRRHIEVALERGYVQNVFFPDMGHTHLLIPLDAWESLYQGFPIPKLNEFYGTVFADPRLQILYHTAEQLRTMDEKGQPRAERAISWRYHTRNLVGDNRAQGVVEVHQDAQSAANTLRDLAGHFYYGAGFNLSASRDGCFPYIDHGVIRYFDLSLSDLAPSENDGVYVDGNKQVLKFF